jgi:gamma-glutamylcyclotransferase (GGCT)/AIG2-like uncharacterized protein YtfP
LTVRLFVYGTLAPGREAWPVLAQWATGAPCQEQVAGTLYDTGRGYPAAVFGDAGTNTTKDVVHGYVVDLDTARAAEALATLDRYEGDEYERVTVRTAYGIEAETYSWIAPLSTCRRVAGGRWDRV